MGEQNIVADLTDEQIDSAANECFTEGNNLTRHQWQTFARKIATLALSHAKPAEGGVVEALNNLIHAINWRAGVYASSSSQEKMAFADEQMWKAVDAGKAALAREGGA